MRTVNKRTPGTIVAGYFLLCHPLPVLFHIFAVAIFALLAGWPHIAWDAFILVIAAHAAMQASIAVFNDYCDRQVDALSKRNKPIVHGLITSREALFLGSGLIILMVILLLPLPRLALLISLLYLTCGMAYNIGLKATPFSGVVFALAIPLIPLYAFAGMNHLLPFIFWLIPVAALLGIALNLANSLPDIEEDAANHTRTLAVALGVRGTFLACPLLILISAGIILVLALTNLVTTRLWVSIPTLVVTCLLTGGLHIFLDHSGPVKQRKGYFYLVVGTCLLLAGGWLISILL